MPQFENYEVLIHVDGEKLPEYGVQHSTRAGRTEITCWIPSEVGKCPGEPILDSRKTKPFMSDSVTQKGTYVSNNSYRPFVFANCQLIDDDEFVSSSPDPGQISVDIERIAVGECAKDSDNYKPFPEPKVHERSKKGLVHGIQLGPECLEKRAVRHSTTIQHIVTFKFNYRPLDKLQADGVVPLSIPSNAEEGEEEEDARIQALKEELCALESRRHQKKRKRGDSKTPPKHVKKERTIALDNNVIDLT